MATKQGARSRWPWSMPGDSVKIDGLTYITPKDPTLPGVPHIITSHPDSDDASNDERTDYMDADYPGDSSGMDDVYAGGSGNFDERTGKYRDSAPKPKADGDTAYMGGSPDFDEWGGKFFHGLPVGLGMPGREDGDPDAGELETDFDGYLDDAANGGPTNDGGSVDDDGGVTAPAPEPRKNNGDILTLALVALALVVVFKRGRK